MEIDGCALPEDRLYDLEHDVWVLPGPDGTPATVGILASFAAFAGRFLSVGFRPHEGTIRRGQSLATVESTRLTAPVRMPLDGMVLEQNADLRSRPKLLNDAPYDRGWIVRVRLREPDTLTARLATASAIRDPLAAKIRELRIRCYPAAPDLEMYEIGSECAAILVRLDQEVARRSPEDVILLVTDDPTSPIEMVRWSDRSGHPVLHHRVEGNLHHFLVRKEARPTPRLWPGPRESENPT